MTTTPGKLATDCGEPVREMFRDYTVIKSPTGKRWSVYWRDSYIEGEALCWADGGFVSGHRSEQVANAHCDTLNASVPLDRRPPTKEPQS